MSFRSEVRNFISEQKSKDATISILLSELADLRKQNNSLMDRLMATNFQELKVYSNDEDSIVDVIADEELNIEDDYQNAGEIV